MHACACAPAGQDVGQGEPGQLLHWPRARPELPPGAAHARALQQVAEAPAQQLSVHLCSQQQPRNVTSSRDGLTLSSTFPKFEQDNGFARLPVSSCMERALLRLKARLGTEGYMEVKGSGILKK